MATIFIREQQRYSLYKLKDLFRLKDNLEKEVNKKINKLKKYGILKSVQKSKEQLELTDLQDEDIEISVDVDSEETDKSYYVFTFVGVLTLDGDVLVIYPKYIHKNQVPMNEMKQILKVLEKYNASEQVVKIYNDAFSESTYNWLALILYIINDYYENGIYSKEQKIFEVNGNGEINWDKTISQTYAILAQNRPCYPELITQKKQLDEINYFKQLHEYVVSSCFKELSDNQLANLFEIDEINLIERDLDDFGDVETILDRVSKELSVQFNTQKQLILKMIYSYIAKKGFTSTENSVSLFGTNNFKMLWEKVCAKVFNNQLNTVVRNIPYLSESSQDEDRTLIKMIEKPKWLEVSSNTKEYMESKDTLKPDIITINKNDLDNTLTFYIFDAKYYDLNLSYKERILKGYPGIDSIDKQYMYQLAYKDFIAKQNINSVVNCFLLPTEADAVIDKGVVYMDMMRELKLEDIHIRLLPANKVFDFYLHNRHFSIDDLKF